MEEKQLKRLSKILINYRNHKHLTQDDLALILNVSKSTLVKIEKETYTGSATKLLNSLLKLDFQEKEYEFIKSLIPSFNKIKQRENVFAFENTKLDLIEKFMENTYLLNKIEEQEKLLKNYEEKLKFLDLVEKNDIKTLQRLRAANSDMTNTSQIIKLMWKLKDESSKYFSELELLLKMNKAEENEKMKKGLVAVGESLIREGEALIKLSGGKGDIINIK